MSTARRAALVLGGLTGVLLLVMGAVFTILTVSTTETRTASGATLLAGNAPWVGPLAIVAGALGVAGGIAGRHRALSGTLLALCLGCTLFDLGSAFDDGYVRAIFAVASIALALALTFTLTVRLAALLFGGLTGAFLLSVGVVITIYQVSTADNGTAPWVGPSFIVVGALGVLGAIFGPRNHRLAVVLLSVCLGVIVLCTAGAVLVFGLYSLILFAPLGIALALALAFTLRAQRPLSPPSLP